MAVAAVDDGALRTVGYLAKVSGFEGDAVIVRPKVTKNDGVKTVWCKVSCDRYRDAYVAATGQKEGEGIQPLDDNNNVFAYCADVDHVYPRSWARQNGYDDYWLMLYPVMGNVNRSAGASIEKNGFKHYSSRQVPAHGIIWAVDYQIMKMLNHPVYEEKAAVKLFK
ncbi:hypothetical protein [Ketobacter sp.]|uniref:hypothetical protein n=1 Tax=Ketobacter sp. TaxID=2083498 RepID=UPI0025B7B669|nr:hypothetical protein [Ketobacter sp.]